MRYYYTDPLAAAWMAKHHGMRFINPSESIRTLHKISDILCESADGGITGMCGIFYIHPEDVNIIYPKGGDYLEIKDPDYFGGSYITSISDKHSMALGLPLDHQYGGKKFRIIMRNGTPFIWPETESVTEARA